MNKSENIKVIVKFRPSFINKDLAHLEFDNDKQSLVVDKAYEKKKFTFNRIFDTNSTNEELWSNVADPLLSDFFNGHNGTILAYGQTGTGKTYTIIKTIIPYCLKTIFKKLNNKLNLKISCLQIYNDKITDLLNDKNEINIRENKGNFFIDNNLLLVSVNNYEEAMICLENAQNKRNTSNNNVNNESSRSHLLFQIRIFKNNCYTTLNLLDLAGSERINKINSTSDKKGETIGINKSLSILGKCIFLLGDKKSKIIPYRESKLTKLLKESLGGNSKTSFVITLSPDSADISETISSLKFGSRACHVQCKPIIPEQLDIKQINKNLQEELKFTTNKWANQSSIIQELQDENLQLNNIINDQQFKINELEKTNRYENPNTPEYNNIKFTIDKKNTKDEKITNFMNTDYMNSFEDIHIVKETTENIKKKLIENKENKNNNLFTNSNKKKKYDQKFIDNLLNEIQKTNDKIEKNNLIMKQNKQEIQNYKINLSKLENELLNKNKTITGLNDQISYLNNLKYEEISSMKIEFSKIKLKYEEVISNKDKKLNEIKNISTTSNYTQTTSDDNNLIDKIQNLWKIDKNKIYNKILLQNKNLMIKEKNELNINKITDDFNRDYDYLKTLFKDLYTFNNRVDLIYNLLNKLLLTNLNDNNSLSSNILKLSMILNELIFEIKNSNKFTNYYNFLWYFKKSFDYKSYFKEYLLKKRLVSRLEVYYKKYKIKKNTSKDTNSYTKFQAFYGKMILQNLEKEITNNFEIFENLINCNKKEEESFYIELNNNN